MRYLLLLFPLLANAGLTDPQQYLLSRAAFYGAAIGWEETAQSILLQESSAGAAPKIEEHEAGIGAMRVRPSTAEYVARIYPLLNKIRGHTSFKEALLDDEYNVLAGVLYFKRCYDIMQARYGRTQTAWRRAVVAYNVGITGANSLSDNQINEHPYLKHIKKRIQYLRTQ